ncbi:MAG: response regulator transcription factor [Caldilineaceae bacterium SB0670_bin_27]|uniref:Response regulator transcription factor n=1 Tax=Caldilineaceae bacterium SB0664_bin_27 TaxID=2605260 RepID=A0A6B0YPK2_9CHLR|nr:response regulator transcription factor [Caldilineaceae bacterium SB0664_bin_27]MYJ77852.1 response regulator transcription factor [Caldilineaceae bacterium SB0670_bin_27]
MDKTKILIVEDEPTLLDTLKYSLEQQGYEVVTASDGVQALAKARTEKPGLVILDLMLPGLDGIEVCRILRQEMSLPILMLTAKDEEVDKIVGLEVGADDYLTKPFSMRELLARVRAHLRRVRLLREELESSGQADQKSPNGDVAISFGDLVIDESRREIRRNDDVLALRPKEFELLLFLARNRGIALGRSLILERVWGWDFDGGSRTVDVHIRWLREKIEVDPAHPSRILTIRGIGYRFDG